jgi:hypothetical protein
MKVYGVINKKTKKLENRFAYGNVNIAVNRAKRFMRVANWSIELQSKTLEIPDGTTPYSVRPETYLLPWDMMVKEFPVVNKKPIRKFLLEDKCA